MDQLSLLSNILNNKEVSGTYNGIEFKGQVVEVYPVYHRGNAPISFTVRLEGQCKGIPTEDENTAVFYASDTRSSNGAILQLKKVAFNKSKKNSK